MAIKLLKVSAENFEVDGVKVTTKTINPEIQMLFVKQLSVFEKSTDDIAALTKSAKQIFVDCIESFEHENNKYNPSDFFDMLNVFDVGTQTFIANVISKLVDCILLDKEEAKK